MNSVRHKCVYRGCGNDDRLKKNISYFKFPVSNACRTKLWQEHCGNVNIASLSEIDDLKRKVICELHFSPLDIRKNNKRKLLSNTAVPIRYRGKESRTNPVELRR